MIKNIALTAIFLLFLNGCNYEPIYSLKNENFTIGEIELTGNKKINKLLIKKLEIYKKNKSNKIKYDLNIASKVNKSVSTKDKKGNPTTFTLTIAFKVKVKSSFGEKKLKVFEQYTSYENNDNKFNLRRYEDSIKKNMLESINENIILYLKNLN